MRVFFGFCLSLRSAFHTLRRLKADEVKAALEAYVASEQQSMEHYLEDQYQIAKAATVTVAPTGEVILVCAENHDTLLANIEKALAA